VGRTRVADTAVAEREVCGGFDGFWNGISLIVKSKGQGRTERRASTFDFDHKEVIYKLKIVKEVKK
jgi:hypothetical protein